jgi:biopolymer transport protein ExbB
MQSIGYPSLSAAGYGIVAEWLPRDLAGLLERGGPVLWIILVVSSLLWALIVERYLFLWWVQPKRFEQCLAVWRERAERRSWGARCIRAGLLGSLSAELRRHLGLIAVFIQLLPLLGLFGTVLGMIETFEAMAVHGSGNVRAMASGISKALLTTAAGLLTALSGLYFSTDLEQRVEREMQRAGDRLE